MGRGDPLPIAEMPKFKKACSDPLHSEWKTEAVKDLTKFGGLQPFIKAFQSNLVPRVFLRHTLITKPNEHPGTLR